MGTWGPGNLDSDYARNIRDDRTRELLSGIVKRLNEETAAQWDEYDHDRLFFDLEVLFALHAKNLITGHLMPNATEVQKATERYLRTWEAYAMGAAGSGEFWQRRKLEIQRTFRSLVELCERQR